MLRNATIETARAWYTWSDRPAEMVFLPLGVRVTPVAYAASSGKATLFPPGETLRLGVHTLDGGVVALDLSHAGTRIGLEYRKADPFSLLGRWRAGRLGEWGLRFWFNLCLSAEDGCTVRFDPARQAAIIKVGHRFVALAAAEAPVQVTGHATIEALAADYETHGYFHLGSQAAEAPVLALRFNLEMTRDSRFAAAVADDADFAVGRATELLGEDAARAPGALNGSAGSSAALGQTRDSDELLPASAGVSERPWTGPVVPTQTGRFAGALDAVRDVMAWNTVWDEINARPYTSISRNWNLSKFGGFGVWLNDQQYAAVLTGLLDAELARHNLAAALASATPAGNLACLITANDAWVDRSQLPIGSFLVWLMYLRSRSRPLLQLAYDTLARNHAWWWRHRDPHGRGLASYGTSEVGGGLYKGTSFGARNESSMDNAPIHDEAPYDPSTRTLASLDVGLNSLLALDAEILSHIAAELGAGAVSVSFTERAEATRARIRAELWDDGRGIFANRLWSGAFVRSLGPTSFYPLLCGAPTPDQTRRLTEHLADPKTFGGRFVLPGVTRDDPAYRDNTYWRGRIWPPLNYLVWQGLRRCGLHTEATRLATASFSLFRAAWDSRRLCPENYNAETGEPLDQPDTEGFYNWGALLPLMGVAEVMDVNPWTGWEITNDGDPVDLGPMESPVGPVRLTVRDGVLTLAKGSAILLATNLRGRIAQLRFGDEDLALTLPEAIGQGAVIRLPEIASDQIIFARAGETDLPWQADAGGAVVPELPAQAAGRRLRICYRTPRPGR